MSIVRRVLHGSGETWVVEDDVGRALRTVRGPAQHAGLIIGAEGAREEPELVHEADWATHVEAYAAVAEYLEIFYNTQRRHSALGYVSPVAFERQHREKLAA